MWDVPSSVIFCSSCILLLPGVCCIYFSNPFFVSPVTTGIVVAFIPPHCFNFDFKVIIFWQFFSYMNWRILFGGGGHINKQAALFLFVLDNEVCFVGLYLTICQYLHIPQDCDVVSLVPRPVRTIRVTRVGLEPSATVWGSCSYHFSFPALWNLLSYVKILNWKKIYARFHSRKQPDLVATIFSRRSRLWEPWMYL